MRKIVSIKTYSFSKTDTCFVSKLKLYGLILSLFYSCEINCCCNVSVKYITLVESRLVMLLLQCKSQLFLIISLRIELHKNCSNSSYIRSICFPKCTTSNQAKTFLLRNMFNKNWSRQVYISHNEYYTAGYTPCPHRPHTLKPINLR